MITELTEKQKELIPVYVEKWAKIGLSTEPVKDYEETINLFYEKVLNKKRPTKIILAPSPLHACRQVDINIWLTWKQLTEQVEKYIWMQLEKQLWEMVNKQVRRHIIERVWWQIGEQIFMQVMKQIWWQVGDQIWGEVWRRIERWEHNYYLLPFFDGRYGFNKFAFYDYFNEVLNICYPPNWDAYKSTAELGFVFPFNNTCIVLNRPEQLIMKNGLLHNEKGMAIKYRDSWGLYSLNGVTVSKEIAETPADKLDPEIILKETNVKVKLEIIKKIKADKLYANVLFKEAYAEVRREIVKKMGADKIDTEILLKETNVEVRREIVRKIGVERLEEKLKPHVLDKWGDYELHDYSDLFLDMQCRPVYLKMKNPSIGVWHYEGVNIDEMEAPTCQAALKWRLKGKDFKPIRIT